MGKNMLQSDSGGLLVENVLHCSRRKLLYSMCFLVLSHCAMATGAYPALQNVLAPNPEPTLPAGCDVFVPPVDSQTPAANTPAIAEWTRTAGPDESMVVTGNLFTNYAGADAGKDTEFLTYGQQASGTSAVFADTAVQRLDGMKAAMTLDSGLPSWSMYLVWPKNSNGYGYPIAVNRTDAWWTGPKKAIAGSTASVFGRNLAYQNGTSNSNVYVKPATGAGQWATVTAVNPYKVDFTVPNLSNGNYEVWIHNGHGGSYGWSGPLALTIYSGPGWTSTVFNVRDDYHAKGDGVTDDTTAIKAAIAASSTSAYSSVYFPAGNYMVSSLLTPRNNTRWFGDGKDSTSIKCMPGYTPTAILSSSGITTSNLEFRDLTIDNNGMAPGNSIVLRGITDISFVNVVIKGKGSIHDLQGCNNLKIQNCDFIGRQLFLSQSSQTFISNCNFYQTSDCTTAILEWGCSELSVANCTAQDENSSLVDGCGQGRFFTGNGCDGASRNVYIGDNVTHDLSPRPDYSNQNTGEQLMWEGNVNLHYGNPIYWTLFHLCRDS